MLALMFAVGCTEDAVDGPFVCTRESHRSVPISQPAAWDVLYVLDRSASMADQRVTAPMAGRWLGALLEGVGAAPDLRLAVVTSDLGGVGVPGCGVGGDRARFEAGTRCGLDDNFIRWDRRRGERNFPGGLVEATECLFDRPPSTCPLSQPLAAALRALDGSNPQNDGFRRPGAELLIALVTDSDDCSLLAPNELVASGLSLANEAAVDFACFARGTACEPDEPTRPGLHQTCRPRPGGLADPARTIALAAGGERIHVAVARGVGEVEVRSGPALAPTCDEGACAGPAPRLASLIGTEVADVNSSFFYENGIETVVNWGWGWGWGNPCLDPRADLEPDVPGVQVRCQRHLVWERAPGSPPDQPLPWCGALDHQPGGPCLRLLQPEESKENCPLGEASVQFEAGATPLALGAKLELDCELPCP